MAMSQTRKNEPLAANRPVADRTRVSGPRRRAVSAASDEHMGAMETQVRPTMPPKTDDDETKQG